MKLSFNVLHERHAATSVIPGWTRHAFLKLAFAVDNGSTATGITALKASCKWILKAF